LSTDDKIVSATYSENNKSLNKIKRPTKSIKRNLKEVAQNACHQASAERV
jgi:hypothetical protein